MSDAERLPSYFCIWCEREIVPEEHEDGLLYVHDETHHPYDFNQDDEKVIH